MICGKLSVGQARWGKSRNLDSSEWTIDMEIVHKI